MGRARIRWRNVGRLAAAVGAGGMLIGVVPGMLEPPEPEPLPADVGLATGTTGAYAYSPPEPRRSEPRAQPPRPEAGSHHRRPQGGDRPERPPRHRSGGGARTEEPGVVAGATAPAPASAPSGQTAAPVPASAPTPAPAAPPAAPAPTPDPAMESQPAHSDTPRGPSQFSFEQ